jgi:hypothetical protein
MFSRQCEYALQATLFLALKKQGERVSIKDLAGKLKIPEEARRKRIDFTVDFHVRFRHHYMRLDAFPNATGAF